MYVEPTQTLCSINNNSNLTHGEILRALKEVPKPGISNEDDEDEDNVNKHNICGPALPGLKMSSIQPQVNI